MSTIFANHSYASRILKHKKLPIYKTKEFDFFRCVNVEEWVYEKNISSLHKGNLRENNNPNNRYSKLFPNEKISYWADSKATALAEIKKHNGNKNYLTFHAYDDLSSTFPILDNEEELIILDGKNLDFNKILLKIESNKELNKEELEIINLIKMENPDCLAYESVVVKGSINFLFFEKGFKKLALKEVKLYWGELNSKNNISIPCAITSDYAPILENYGVCFGPIVRRKVDLEYYHTEEFKKLEKNYEKALKKISSKD
ncbi:MAG: hypothetical protein ACRCYE_10845 [Sarcina sp.]